MVKLSLIEDENDHSARIKRANSLNCFLGDRSRKGAIEHGESMFALWQSSGWRDRGARLKRPTAAGSELL